MVKTSSSSAEYSTLRRRSILERDFHYLWVENLQDFEAEFEGDLSKWIMEYKIVISLTIVTRTEFTLHFR